MEVREFMKNKGISTIHFIHDFKTNKVFTDPPLKILDEWKYIEELLTKRGIAGGHEELIIHLIKHRGRHIPVIPSIHDSIQGRPLGGTRLRNDYLTERHAFIDGLDLSEGMSGKAIWARTGTSGGKVVIVGDPELDRTEEFLENYGEFIQRIDKLITAEDMNIKVSHIAVIARKTRNVVGVESDDPSPGTAFGVFVMLQEGIKLFYGVDSFKGLVVPLRGISGGVGSYLARHLIEAGATIVGSYWQHKKKAQEVAQELKEKAKKVGHKLEIKIVSDKEFWKFLKEEQYQIVSFNTAGKEINAETISLLKPGILLGGGSNNQLDDPRDELGDQLWKMGTFYFPDFVINFGGLKKVCGELSPGGYNEERVIREIEGVGRKNAVELYNLAKEKNISPHRVADEYVEEIIRKSREEKLGSKIN